MILAFLTSLNWWIIFYIIIDSQYVAFLMLVDTKRQLMEKWFHSFMLKDKYESSVVSTFKYKHTRDTEHTGRFNG